jgi:Uma2 family endonuclease
MSTTATLVSAEEYERIALAEPDRKWEWERGLLREKAGMSYGHFTAAFELGVALRNQLPRDRYHVNVNGPRLKRVDISYYVPDVIVVSAEKTVEFRRDPTLLEAYAEPALLVVEVWSPSTGDHDLQTKLHAYKARGDLEIWLLHPFERRLTVWRRQTDGAYTEELFDGGPITPIALPEATINLDDFFV